MRIDVVSLFPEMFSVVGELGVTGRAQRLGLWSLHIWNPRDYTHDVHRTVDDRPYGGGPGMVMLAEPLEAALDGALTHREQQGVSLSVPVVLMSPAGQRFDQGMAQELASGPGAVFICGRYEGVDQRFIDRRVTHEVSLGDFVLSGGELPAMACIDAAVRLLPGALNDRDSARQDSFNEATSGLLDSPHYTRPERYHELDVPEILRSGHHANIAKWRREQSLALTAARRPDLIKKARLEGRLSKKDEAFLRSLESRPRPT